MPQGTAINVVDGLRQSALLDVANKDELGRLECQFPRPRDLVQELVRRGMLTAHQGHRILEGKIHELVLGQYLLLDKLGEGGMGQVFKARQRNLERLVALKVIRKECLDNPRVISRFQREIQAAGHLSHPNIVRAYDADEVNGTYFIAMEYIDGVDLAKMVKDNGPLPVDQSCDFIRQAALGLQHAFERGLVHRDIKPANLLVSRVSDKARISSGKLLRPDLNNLLHAKPSPWGTVKVLDLGLARWDDTVTGRASTHLTQMGSVMGTPEFIAPEQARNSHTCDIRADLYSLGCTLYYILTGRAPFLGGSLAEKLIQHQVDDAEPVGPVRRAMLVSYLSRKGAKKASRRLLAVPDDVAAIVKKLMAKKPEDRFQTPAELAASLDQALDRMAKVPRPKSSELVETAEDDIVTPAPAAAEQPTLYGPLVQVATMHGLKRHSTGPLWRRRWLPLGAIGLVALVGGILGVLSGGARPQAGSVEANAAKEPKDGKSAREADDPAWLALRNDVRQKKLSAVATLAKLTDYRRRHPGKASEIAGLFQQVPSPFDAYDRTKIDTKQWYAWMPDEIVGILGIWRGGPINRSMHSISVSPNGQWIASGGDDRAFRIWETAGSLFPWRVEIPTWNRVLKVAVSPDGARLASASDDGVTRLFDVSNRKPLFAMDKFRKSVNAIAFHPNGGSLATAHSDGFVRLWSTTTGDVVREIETNTAKVLALAFTPDGKHLFWGGDNQGVNWTSFANKNAVQAKFAANAGPTKVLAFHPDGHTFVCGGGDGTLRLCAWDGLQIKQKAVLQEHTDAVHDAVFAPDGLTFATGGDDKHLRVWDSSTGALKKTWELRFPIHGVAFAPDSRHLLCANANSTLYIFRVSESVQVAQARPATARN